MTLRIIGDTHGKNIRVGSRYYYEQAGLEGRTYLKIVNDADIKGIKHTLQIGDIGWREDLAIMAGLSPDYHKVLYGNHDDYDNILPHSLGDYGITTHGGVTFGYFRGEYSIDKERRTTPEEIARFGKTWWEDEEISYLKMQEAIDFFAGRKLELFVSHGAPDFLIPQLVPVIKYANSRTSVALARIHDAAEIKQWVFGHYHTNKDLYSHKTDFTCISELAYVDVTEQHVLGHTF